MSKLTLTYFDGKGRAEAIRLTLSIGKLEFEDRRLSYEQWGKVKQEGGAKFGQLPLFEVDGKQYAQSRAILRYSGRLTGLYPDNIDEALLVDEGVDLVEDVLSKLVHPFFLAQTEQEKIDSRKKLQNEVLPPLLNYYNQQVVSGKSGFYGSKLSIADLYVYSVLAMILSGQYEHFSYSLDNHKGLQALVQKIDSIPEVQAFNAKHKK